MNSRGYRGSLKSSNDNIKLINRDIKIHIAVNRKESKNFISSVFPNTKIIFVDLKLTELNHIAVNNIKFDVDCIIIFFIFLIYPVKLVQR